MALLFLGLADFRARVNSGIRVPTHIWVLQITRYWECVFRGERTNFPREIEQSRLFP